MLLHLQIPIGGYVDREDLVSKIKSLDEPQKGATNIVGGINMMRSTFEADDRFKNKNKNSDVRFAAIFITDGAQNYPFNIVDHLNAIRVAIGQVHALEVATMSIGKNFHIFEFAQLLVCNSNCLVNIFTL